MWINGTYTQKNLLKAFVWESQTRMRYDYFAKQAKKDWYEQISSIFEETALNEKEHAKRFFKFLDWWELEITTTFLAWIIWDTLQNLKQAFEWENEEWTSLYPEFARVAKQEWFDEIANIFEEIAKVEQAHEQRFKKLYQNITNWTVFKKESETLWKCRNCWYNYTWFEAPDLCPACAHPKPYFEIKSENY